MAEGDIRYKNMDNNQTKAPEPQDMENWKKQILLDPLLNSLYDPSISGEDFLVRRVLPLPHAQIVTTYTKLSTINFELAQSMQKEVEAKCAYVERAYLEFLDYRDQIEGIEVEAQAKSRPLVSLNYLKSFNAKYETVEKSMVLWRNICIALHFSKGLEKFKVNVNILKTLMRGYNGNEETINPIKVAKMLAQIISLSSTFDFSQVRAFETERAFIASTKSIVYEIGCKTIPRLLMRSSELSSGADKAMKEIQHSLEEWISAMHSLGCLREFIINYFKPLLAELVDKIKKNIQSNFAGLEQNMHKVLIPYLASTCKCVIFLEEKLMGLRKVELANVPNLFVKLWEKMCEILHQTILWAKKDQESKHSTSSREAPIVWKYPVFFEAFSSLNSEVHTFLLAGAQHNAYNLAKNKERLMVGTLLQLAVQYHLEVRKVVESTGCLFAGADPPEQFHHRNLQSEVTKALGPLQKVLREVQNPQLYPSVIETVVQSLVAVTQQAQRQTKPDEERPSGKNPELLNMLRRKIKGLLVAQPHAPNINKKWLVAFNLEKYKAHD